MATHSYLKVKIYDNPAWEAGTLQATLTDVTSVDVTLNRGLNPHTASFSMKNTGADCDYAGKGVVISAYCTGDVNSETEVFRGFIIERRKVINAKSLTHTGWEFECEDVMATWEAYEYDINMYDENGIDDSDIAPSTRPPKFYDYGGAFPYYVRHFNCSGNAMALFAEFRKQDGHVVSGRGDIDGLSESDNIQVLSSTETVPECEGIQLTYKKNNNTGSGTEIVKNIFMAKSQQWWVPIAWSEEDDDTGEYTLHIIYQTSVQHTRVVVGSETGAEYEALYFDDEEQTYTVIDESEIADSETGTVPDYDYTLFGYITLIKPTANSIHTPIMIHKSYTFTEAPESEEKTGASLIAQFKKELPDVMALHISTGAANPRQEEYEYGSEPFQQEDVGYIIYGGSKSYPVINPLSGEVTISLPEVIGTYALERMAEMQFTNEKQYQYTYSLVQKIPIPAHGDEGGDLYKKVSSLAYDNPDYIVESTRLSWDGDGVNISTTIRYKSDKTAAYKRISKYNLPRYFKKQMTTQIEKISEADYAKIEGDSIIFTIGDEEVKISLTDNILTDDGIVRW